jgi:hypothetical protein
VYYILDSFPTERECMAASTRVRREAFQGLQRFRQGEGAPAEIAEYRDKAWVNTPDRDFFIGRSRANGQPGTSPRNNSTCLRLHLPPPAESSRCTSNPAIGSPTRPGSEPSARSSVPPAPPSPRGVGELLAEVPKDTAGETATGPISSATTILRTTSPRDERLALGHPPHDNVGV